jgi:hypothetical protein
MCSANTSEDDHLKKDILKGRIWPAIKCCVNNRYRIVISIFAFYSFMMTSTIQSIKDNFDDIKFYASIMFTLLTALNSYNYIQNSRDQSKLEKDNPKDTFCTFCKRNDVELAFFTIMMFLVWGSFVLITDC